MPQLSPRHFVQWLDELHLLSAPQRTEFEKDLLPRLTEPKALAGEMLRRGWLTPYQVNQLLQGNRTGLRLGQYLFLERLGEGGTGQVFKARHLHMNRVVALKVIRPELTVDAEVVGRFYREIQVISQLNHPNIIHAYDAGPEGNVHTLVMEYVQGTDLAKLVKQSGTLPAGRACDYIRQAAFGLAHAHQKGLIHRDIKPSNLFLSFACEKGQGTKDQGQLIKLLDLGLARLQRSADGELTSTLTPVGSVTMGTPDYLAPEQALNFHQVDIRADIYSLGCTLFFLLTGQPPFPGGSLAQKILRHQQAEPPRLETLSSGLPRGLSAVVSRMLAKRPEDRYQTPTEVAAALEGFISADGSSARITKTMNAGTVPDWKADTTPRAQASPVAAVPPSKSRSRLDPTMKLVPPAPPGRLRRPLLIGAGVGAVFLVGLVLALFVIAGNGKPRAEPTVAGATTNTTGATTKTTSSSAAKPRIDKLQGKVFWNPGTAQRPARLGDEPRPGETLRTEYGGLVRLNREDRATVQLGGATTLTELPADGANWRLKIGSIRNDAAASLGLRAEVQKAGAPLVLITPHGEVTLSQGRVHLAANPTTTWLRVDEGTAQLLQSGATKAVPVAAGNYARFGPSASAVVQPMAAAVMLIDDCEKEVNNWWPFGGEKEKAQPRRAWVSPGKVGKQAIRFDYDFGQMVTHAGMCFYTSPHQDWGRYRTLSFWFHGGQTNNEISMWIWTANGNYLWSFKDDFAGWRQIAPLLTSFKKGDQPGRPEDFRGVKQIDFRVHTTGKGSFQIDQMQLLEHEILR